MKNRSTTPKRNKHDGSCMHIQKKHRQKGMQKVSSITSVDMATGDQGMYELKMREMTGKMNRTPRRRQGSCRTATSSCTSYRRFAELHQHQVPTNNRAFATGVFPEGLSCAVCVERMKETRTNLKILKLLDVVSGSKMDADDIEQKDQRVGYRLAWDNVSGEELDVEEMKVARKRKKEYIEGRGVRSISAKKQ